MEKTKTRGAPLQLRGGLTQFTNGQQVSISEFMIQAMDTSPTILEQLSGIPRKKWWAWRKNFFDNKMSIDKQFQIIESLNCKISPISVTINLKRYDN